MKAMQLILLCVFTFSSLFFSTLNLFSSESPQIAMFEKFKGGTVDELIEETVVPFTLKRSHVIQIPAIIHDYDYTLILDTGGMTMLNSDLNDSLNYETMETPQPNVLLAVSDEICLGDACVSGMKISLTDFNDTYKLDHPGMIGSDFLRFFNVEIDYQQENITLRNSYEMQKERESQHLLKIKMITPYFPTVKMTINGEINYPGMIDTGLHYGFVFPVSWLDNLSEEDKKNLIEVEGYFVRWPWNESPQNYLYLMPEIKLGDIVLQDVPVLLGDIPEFLGNKKALIGKYFLENYLTTLDYPNRQIRLEEIENTNYDLSYSTGIHLAKKEGILQITGVLKNSPAWKAGIHPSDSIIAVNGKNFDEISELELCNIMMDRNIAKFYITVMKAGEEKEILLRKEKLFK